MSVSPEYEAAKPTIKAEKENPCSYPSFVKFYPDSWNSTRTYTTSSSTTNPIGAPVHSSNRDAPFQACNFALQKHPCQEHACESPSTMLMPRLLNDTISCDMTSREYSRVSGAYHACIRPSGLGSQKQGFCSIFHFFFIRCHEISYVI